MTLDPSASGKAVDASVLASSWLEAVGSWLEAAGGASTINCTLRYNAISCVFQFFVLCTVTASMSVKSTL